MKVLHRGSALAVATALLIGSYAGGGDSAAIPAHAAAPAHQVAQSVDGAPHPACCQRGGWIGTRP